MADKGRPLADLDARLEIAWREYRPGHEMTVREISELSGIHKRTIGDITTGALAKLRKSNLRNYR